MPKATRKWATIGLLASTIVAGFLTASMLLSEEFRLGASHVVTDVDEYAFGPVSDGRFLVYREGCRDHTTEHQLSRTYLICQPHLIVIRDLQSGEAVAINETLSSQLMVHANIGSPYVVADGTWPTAIGVLNLSSAQLADAPWEPLLFWPETREGQFVYGYDGASASLTRYDLLNADNVMKIRNAPGSLCLGASGILRVEAPTLLLADCLDPGKLWRGKGAQTETIAWEPLDAGFAAGESESGGRALADLSRGTIIVGGNRKGESPEVVAIDASDATIRWRATVGSAETRLIGISAHDGRWVASFEETSGDGQATIMGYLYGHVEDSKIRRIEFDNPTQTGVVTTRAFPIGDTVYYDVGSSIYQATPGQYPVPPVLAIGFVAILVTASAVLLLTPKTVKSKLMRLGRCSDCGYPTDDGGTFCLGCGKALPIKQS